MFKAITLLFFLFLSLPAGAVSLSWSGWSRFEAYYQHSDKPGYYGNYHFVLQPQIHLRDGLDFHSRFDLWPPHAGSAFKPVSLSPYKQTGFVFLYRDSYQENAIPSSQFLLSLSQFYIDYQNEFLKIRLGRAPYHFGLGTVYSAEENPFHHWISVYNQMAVHLEYSSLYFQPAILQKMNSSESNIKITEEESPAENTVSNKPIPALQEFLGVLQAGLLQKDWQVSLLGQYHFNREQYFASVYGAYKQTHWELKASSSYAFTDNTNFALALEGVMKFPLKIPLQLEIKAGAIAGELAFHPNYDLALLFGNRGMESQSATQDNQGGFYQIARGKIQKSLYFSPRLVFSFFNERLKLKPLFLLAKNLEDKKINYELDLEGHYKFNDYMFFSLTGGALYKQKISFALLGQAAVSF